MRWQTIHGTGERGINKRWGGGHPPPLIYPHPYHHLTFSATMHRHPHRKPAWHFVSQPFVRLCTDVAFSRASRARCQLAAAPPLAACIRSSTSVRWSSAGECVYYLHCMRNTLCSKRLYQLPQHCCSPLCIIINSNCSPYGPHNLVYCLWLYHCISVVAKPHAHAYANSLQQGPV